VYCCAMAIVIQPDESRGRSRNLDNKHGHHEKV
jgi:hypothetical protein